MFRQRESRGNPGRQPFSQTLANPALTTQLRTGLKWVSSTRRQKLRADLRIDGATDIKELAPVINLRRSLTIYPKTLGEPHGEDGAL